MIGYVSKADKTVEKGKVRLRIPNTEIADLFKDAVVARFERTLDTSGYICYGYVEQGCKNASEMLTKILWNSIRYFDYGKE